MVDPKALLLSKDRLLWVFIGVVGINLVLSVTLALNQLGIGYHQWVSYRTTPGIVTVYLSAGEVWDMWLFVGTLLVPLALSIFVALRLRGIWVAWLFFVVWPAVVGLLLFAQGGGGAVVWLLFGSWASLSYLALGLPRTLTLERRTILVQVFTGFIAVLVLIDLLALGRWIFHLFVGGSPYGDPSWHFADVEAKLFYAFQPLMPLLVVSFLYVWLIHPASKVLARSRFVSSRISPWLEGLRRTPAEGGVESPSLRVVLPLAFLLSAVLPFVPYVVPFGEMPWEGFPSVDTVRYYDFLVELRGMNPSDALVHSLAPGFVGTRPLFFVIVHFVGLAFNVEPRVLAIVLPSVLIPLVVLGVGLLSWEGFHSWWLASLAAFLTSTTFVMTVGMFGGLFAQWLGLAFVLLSFAFLLRHFRNGSTRSVALASVFS
ncbi:MAG: hypothetical protein ACE5KH_02070, partial [Candidatus Geothermarchaeales archaeon]